MVGNTEAKVGNINTEVDNASEGEGIERPRHISGEESFKTSLRHHVICLLMLCIGIGWCDGD